VSDTPIADQLNDLIEAALAAEDDDLREFFDLLREGVATLKEELDRRDADLEDEDEEEEEDWEEDEAED
jgi:hypothetical protein